MPTDGNLNEASATRLDGSEVDGSSPAAPGAASVNNNAPSESRIGSWLTRLPRIPFFFLGLGVYRAWIEIVFVGSFVSFPLGGLATQNVFDVTMIITLFLGALFARRIGTLFDRRLAYVCSGLLLLVSTVMMFMTLFMPGCAGYLSLPAAVLGGIGIAVVILMWSEIYGCLNPLRVTYYYCASMISAALLIYLCRGLLAPWVFALCLLMPLLTLFCALLAYRSLSPQETPIVPHSWFSIPWKPMLLMSVYGLAFGLKESGLYTSGFGPHSSFGTLAVSAVIFLAILVQGRRFNINLIYRLALPLIVMAFLLLPSFGFLNNAISDFSVSASYGAFSILTMIILASMSYYYGISALWLFGVERGIRALFIVFGRQVSEHIDLLSFAGINVQAAISIATILLMVTLSLILYSEKDISSRWGISFHGSIEDAADEAVIQKQRLATRCAAITRKYSLTQRESEVLLLLAQKKSIANIEHDLFIANGTAKTHVQHIYKKLGIHNREELSALLELVEEPDKFDAEKKRPE